MKFLNRGPKSIERNSGPKGADLTTPGRPLLGRRHVAVHLCPLLQQLDTSDNNGSTSFFFYTFSWRLSLFIYSTFNIIDTLSASGQPLTLVSIPGPQDAAGDHAARGGLFHPTGTLRRIVEPQLKFRSCAA